MQDGYGVVDSWAIFGIVSGLVKSGDRSVSPSNADNSVEELKVGDGDAFPQAIFGCDPSSARSRGGKDFPPNGASLAHISISPLSERLVFFRSCEIYFGDRPSGGVIIVECICFGSF